MAKDMKEGSLAHLALGARQSSLFSRESFQEEMMKKREANRSVVCMSQQPEPEQGMKGKPKVLYENTYQLDPKRKFQSSAAQEIIKDTLEKYLKDEKYDANASAQMAKTLALVIKDTVKELNYERYRIMCIVSIGQLDEQGIQLVSRCVWDTNRDTSASGSYKNKSLFAVATVFAVYLE